MQNLLQYVEYAKQAESWSFQVRAIVAREIFCAWACAMRIILCGYQPSNLPQDAIVFLHQLRLIDKNCGVTAHDLPALCNLMSRNLWYVPPSMASMYHLGTRIMFQLPISQAES